MFIKRFYKYLMEKYKWSPDRIDGEDFFMTLELETGDWLEEDKKEPVLEYADQLAF